MAGLFTLNDEGLGVLDANALGGFGTGFVVGSVTSAGSVVGVLGFSGTVTGSVSSAGSATGVVGYSGSVSGSQVSAGSVIGSENNTGTISGSTTSAGSATGVKGAVGSVGGTGVPTGSAVGEPGLIGSAAGFSAATGSVSGSPSLSGSVIGSTTSTGTATGTKVTPEPPTPPAPVEPEGGGVARWWYWPAPKIIRRGRTRPRASRTSGSVNGTAGRTGIRTGNVQMTRGFINGLAHIVIPVLIPARDSVAERQAFEDELLTVWVD